MTFKCIKHEPITRYQYNKKEMFIVIGKCRNVTKVNEWKQTVKLMRRFRPNLQNQVT